MAEHGERLELTALVVTRAAGTWAGNVTSFEVALNPLAEHDWWSTVGHDSIEDVIRQFMPELVRLVQEGRLVGVFADVAPDQSKMGN